MLDRCGWFSPFRIICEVPILASLDSTLVLSGSTHSVHPTLTPNYIRSLALTATTLQSLKLCHWAQLYQAVTLHQNLEQVIILRGGPVQVSSRSANHLLSISTFLSTFFTSLKMWSSLYICYVFTIDEQGTTWSYGNFRKYCYSFVLCIYRRRTTNDLKFQKYYYSFVNCILLVGYGSPP